MYHYTKESRFSMEETIARVKEQLQKQKFGVLWEFSIQETLQKKGFDFKEPYTVLEVCSPGEASQILAESKLAGYFLPCKIVVYEDGGKVHVGMVKLTLLFEHLENETLANIARDIEKQLRDVIDQSV